MTLATIQVLLKDHETETSRERRAVQRKPFVRPVDIATGRDRNHVQFAFSKDISHLGIGTISKVEWPQGKLATLTVQSLHFRDISFEAQARWNQSFGEFWYLTGWTFLDR